MTSEIIEDGPRGPSSRHSLGMEFELPVRASAYDPSMNHVSTLTREGGLES